MPETHACPRLRGCSVSWVAPSLVDGSNSTPQPSGGVRFRRSAASVRRSVVRTWMMLIRSSTGGWRPVRSPGRASQILSASPSRCVRGAVPGDTASCRRARFPERSPVQSGPCTAGTFGAREEAGCGTVAIIRPPVRTDSPSSSSPSSCRSSCSRCSLWRTSAGFSRPGSSSRRHPEMDGSGGATRATRNRCSLSPRVAQLR
jgi:hypothetical protein